jgi:hypothetical protein
MTPLIRFAGSVVVLALTSACGSAPSAYFAPQATSGTLLPKPHRDAADFSTDGAYQLSAGPAKVDLEIDAGADGRATGLFLRVHVPIGSAAGFSADSLALTRNGSTARIKLPFSLSGQPFDIGAAAAPTQDVRVRSWKAFVALPSSDALVYDVQLPDLVVDGVAQPLPAVKFTATRGWAWNPTM